MTRTGADDELGGFLGYQLVESDLVVPVYGNFGALKDEVLVHIPGEGVVVVYEDKVRGGRDRR